MEVGWLILGVLLWWSASPLMDYIRTKLWGQNPSPKSLHLLPKSRLYERAKLSALSVELALGPEDKPVSDLMRKYGAHCVEALAADKDLVKLAFYAQKGAALQDVIAQFEKQIEVAAEGMLEYDAKADFRVFEQAMDDALGAYARRVSKMHMDAGGNIGTDQSLNYHLPRMLRDQNSTPNGWSAGDERRAEADRALVFLLTMRELFRFTADIIEQRDAQKAILQAAGLSPPDDPEAPQAMSAVPVQRARRARKIGL